VASFCLLVAGPVERINSAEGYFVSLGQKIYAHPIQLSGLEAGNLVGVQGAILGAGEIQLHQIYQLSGQYTPGSTEVFVTGVPSSVDSALGLATIGDLEVDYTSSLGSTDFEGIGAAVTVIGTQPALGGKMIGSQVQDKTELFLRD